MTIDLRCEADSGRQFATALRTTSRSLLKLLAIPSAELSIVLTSDDAIRTLNRNFRNKDRPTDVLSFPQLDNPSEGTSLDNAIGYQSPQSAHPDLPVALGDIVISVETALGQAHAMGVAPARRLRDLLIHGLLHLLGYDHERSVAEARRMFAKERELAALLDSSAASRGSRFAIVRHARRRA